MTFTAISIPYVKEDAPVEHDETLEVVLCKSIHSCELLNQRCLSGVIVTYDYDFVLER